MGKLLPAWDIREGFPEVGSFYLQKVLEDDYCWPGEGGEEKAVPGSESSEAKGCRAGA